MPLRVEPNSCDGKITPKYGLYPSGLNRFLKFFQKMLIQDSLIRNILKIKNSYKQQIYQKVKPKNLTAHMVLFPKLDEVISTALK